MRLTTILNQKSSLTENFIAPGLFAIIAFLYYSDIFSCWFVADDAAVIVTSTESLKTILFSRIHSGIFYTPLLTLSFKPDVILFGLNSLPYHIHNTMVLILISFVAYKILRLYTDRLSALLPVIIILLSTPSLICTMWITLRQYLYAMLFSLLSVYLFLKYKPDLKNNPFIVLVILLLSELSFMGKGQYMTLPFVLFIVSEGNFKQRVNKTYPYFILVAGHFLLRLYILHGIGGYPRFLYHPIVVYVKTIFWSIFTESRVLFGYNWFIIPFVLPLLLKPKKIFLALLLWIASLSISFLMMSFYPQSVSYRYWFISTILFSFAFGFSGNFIRNIFVKILYSSTIIGFFLLHSLPINKDIKASVKKESLLAKQITQPMFNMKYRHSLILFPDSVWVNSLYIDYMSKAYYKVNNIKSYPPFFPFELLSFYPTIIKDFNDIYEIKDDELVNITDSVNEKINIFKNALLNEKPIIKLIKKNNTIEMDLKCSSAKEIISFELKMIDEDRPYAIKRVGSYVERINLSNVLKIKDAKLLAIEKLSYHNKGWYIGRKPIPYETSFIIFMCRNSERKYTLLSDIVALKK
jgi:hypothetical protein